MNSVFLGDNLSIMRTLPDESVDMVYCDPPFNTGTIMKSTKIETIQDEHGLVGFGGHTYSRKSIMEYGEYNDDFGNNYIDFMKPRILEIKRLLKTTGSFYLHADYREIHYLKILCDEIFGRENFLNEIIWSFNFGAHSKKKFPCKHQTILLYVKDPDKYIFNFDSLPREPYKAPSLVTKEKAAKGKVTTDVIWHTIVPTNSSHEKRVYPTQKPKGLLKIFVKASSNEGDILLDAFAGSGTLAELALELNRKFIVIDSSPAAIKTIKTRLSKYGDINYFDG